MLQFIFKPLFIFLFSLSFYSFNTFANELKISDQELCSLSTAPSLKYGDIWVAIDGYNGKYVREAIKRNLTCKTYSKSPDSYVCKKYNQALKNFSGLDKLKWNNEIVLRNLSCGQKKDIKSINYNNKGKVKDIKDFKFILPDEVSVKYACKDTDNYPEKVLITNEIFDITKSAINEKLIFDRINNKISKKSTVVSGKNIAYTKDFVNLNYILSFPFQNDKEIKISNVYKKKFNFQGTAGFSEVIPQYFETFNNMSVLVIKQNFSILNMNFKAVSKVHLQTGYIVHSSISFGNKKTLRKCTFYGQEILSETLSVLKANNFKEVIKSNNKKKLSKSNITSMKLYEERQKRIELERKLAALENKQKEQQQSKLKTVVAAKPKSEFSNKPININFKSITKRTDDIAVIIGNANYKKQGKDIPNVNPAYADAEGIKQYFMKAKGIKEGNIIYLKDATGSQLASVFGNDKSYKGKLFNYIKPNKSNVYIYYAGHGAPGEQGDAYLVPSDTDAQTIQFTGFQLSTLYSNLGKLPAKSVTVILEACFSGGSQSGSLISKASPIIIAPKKTMIPANVKVIAAGSESQMASWEQDSSHSLFTKYFLKAMSGEGDTNKDGKVSDAELKEYLSDTMTYYARRYYGRDQKVQIHNGG